MSLNTIVSSLSIILSLSFTSFHGFSQKVILDNTTNGIRLKAIAYSKGSCQYINDGKRYSVTVVEIQYSAQNVTGRKINFYGASFDDPGNLRKVLFPGFKQGDGHNCPSIRATTSPLIGAGVLQPNGSFKVVSRGYLIGQLTRPGARHGGWQAIR